MSADEGLHIRRHGLVVMVLDMRAFAVVTQVDSVHGGVQTLGKRLRLRLFCFDPKRPCRITNGPRGAAGLEESAGGSWRVNASGTVSIAEE